MMQMPQREDDAAPGADGGGRTQAPSLGRIRVLVKRWWGTLRAQSVELHPMATLRPCEVFDANYNGWEMRSRRCSDLELLMNQIASNIRTQVLGDILRLVHVASADPQVFHLLWRNRPWCPKLSSCAFCDGLEGQVSVRVWLSCFPDDPRVLEAALFDWDESHSTSEFRELYGTVQATVKWATDLNRVRQQRLRLEFCLADGNIEEADVPVGVRYLHSLLARYRQTSTFCELAQLRCTNYAVKIPVSAYLPIVNAMACSGVPTTLCYSFDSHHNDEAWMEAVTALLGDPQSNIEALTTPPDFSDSDKFIQFTSALQQNTTLQHLNLTWTLSREPATRHQQVLALGCALFSAESRIRLKTLQLQIDGFNAEDGRVLMSCMTGQDGRRIERAVWGTQSSSPEFAGIFAQVLAGIGVRSVVIKKCFFEPTRCDVALAFLQHSHSLVDVTVNITGDSSISKSSYSTVTWPEQTQLQSLKIRSVNPDSDFLANAVDLLLSRIGSQLSNVGLVSLGGLRFSSSVLHALIQHCPNLRNLSVEGADESFTNAIGNAFNNDRLRISTFHLNTYGSGQYDPVIKMLNDQNHPASSIIKKLTLGLCLTSEVQADDFRAMLSRNHVLHTVKLREWKASNASEIPTSPGAHIIETPSATRQLALVWSLKAALPHLRLPPCVLRLIFELSGRTRRRVYVDFGVSLDQ